MESDYKQEIAELDSRLQCVTDFTLQAVERNDDPEIVRRSVMTSAEIWWQALYYSQVNSRDNASMVEMKLKVLKLRRIGLLEALRLGHCPNPHLLRRVDDALGELEQQRTRLRR
jgi:hypothetical protein